jgi:hypothetical protein
VRLIANAAYKTVPEAAIAFAAQSHRSPVDSLGRAEVANRSRSGRLDQPFDMERFGAQDGEKLTTALMKQNILWNVPFSDQNVEVRRPIKWFGDGSTVEVLSPDRAQLEQLAPTWVKSAPNTA